MKTAFQTLFLAAVSLLAVNISQAQSDASPVAATSVANIWSAVTRHRFYCLADLSVRQARVQRAVDKPDAQLRETATSRLLKVGTSQRTPNGELPSQGSPCRSVIKAQVFGNGRWVALGSDGKLRCSTDGVEWNSAHLPVESFLRGVAFGNGRFIAVGGSYSDGGSVILTSVNGRSWTLHPCPTRQVLHAVAYSGDRFIAVGAGGTILTSKTGQRWQKQDSDTDATLAAVAYGNGTCMIGGDDGLMLTSRDTLLWTRQISGTSRYIGNVSFDHNRFVAVAADRHLESSDGSHWQAIDGAAVPAVPLLARTNRVVSKGGPAE